MWKGILAAAEVPADTAVARARLEEALGDLDRKPFAGPIRPSDFYLPTVLAERIGAGAVAADLRGRLASCTLRLDNLDTGWALRHTLGIGS